MLQDFKYLLKTTAQMLCYTKNTLTTRTTNIPYNTIIVEKLQYTLHGDRIIRPRTIHPQKLIFRKNVRIRKTKPNLT